MFAVEPFHCSVSGLILWHFYRYFVILVSSLNLQDHGIARDGSKEIAESQNEPYIRTLLHDLNRHGAVVLEGTAIGKTIS